LLQDFAEAFSDADEVVVTDVFAARENRDPNLSGERIANEINHPSVRHIPDLKDVAQFLEEHVRRDSVVLTLSAGDGNQVGRLLLKNLQKGEVDHG
jgi:UDP-N-acetylmuramate--alanine ligase